MPSPFVAAIGSSRRFATAVEKQYQNDLAREKVTVFVRTNILCAILYASFALLDIFAMSEGLHAAWLIRLGVVALNLGAGRFVARHECLFVRHYTAVVAGLYLIWGLGIEAIIAVAVPGDLAWAVYYAGLILVSTALYTWTYLRPAVAMVVGGLLAATYWTLALGVQKMGERHELAVLLANSYFLVGANVVGLFSLFTRERFARQAFLLKETLRRDIEKGEQAIREKEHVAEHDPLTGLLNRAGFQRRLEDLLHSSAATSGVLGLIFIDLDGFKSINDIHGHAAGDAVLSAVAQRIRGTLRATDVVGRLGGDEFVVALTLAAPHEKVLHRVCEALADTVRQPVAFDGRLLTVHASLGTATSDESGFDGAALLHAADQRMYEHKRRRKARAA